MTRRLSFPIAAMMLCACEASLDGGSSRDAGPISTDGAPFRADAALRVPDGDAAIQPRDDASTVRVVADCTSLAGTDTWTDITPAEADASLEYRITNVAADPIHLGTVYVGTEKRGIFRSVDCGANWTKVNTGRNGHVLDEGPNWVLSIDPVEPEVLYAGSSYSSYNGLLKSTNGGVDWELLWPAGSLIANTVEYDFLNNLSIDPTDHRHLFVTFHAHCAGFSGCMGESTDAGATWRLFETPLAWEEGASTLALGGRRILWATLQNGGYYSGDAGESWTRIGPGNNSSLYRATDGTYYVGSDYGIQKSRDGEHWDTVPGSPAAYGVGGDGTRVYAGLRYPSNGQPYFTSLETDGTMWAPLESPPMTHGPVFFAADPAHNLLYAASTHGGLWRIRTE
jgi:hypothetical protein